jgi:apolipoprotein N-acyltransferase
MEAGIHMDGKKTSLAVLSGLALTLSFPRAGVGLLAWVALVPLLVALRNAGGKQRFFLGFLCGLSHDLTLLYWLAYTMQTYGGLSVLVSVAILVFFSAYLALYTAAFAWAAGLPGNGPIKTLLAVPAAWTALEFVRSHLFTGFPWELLGHSQYSALHLIQIGDIIGPYGISFLVVFSNAALFMVFCRISGHSRQEAPVRGIRAGAAVLVSAIVLVEVWLYGQGRIREVDAQIAAAPTARVTLVQGNIDQSVKWDPAFQWFTAEKYVRLSLQAEPAGSDLVVWPETATPFYLFSEKELSAAVLEGMQEAGATFLVGSPSFSRQKDRIAYYNSAYLIGPEGTARGKYDKAHLVPFGEYVPLKRWLPFLGKMVEHVGDFVAGETGKTLAWGEHRLGVQICYEMIFPDLSRAMAKNGAGLLVNLTNDAWYGRTSAPYQHFSMAVFRAVENRRSVARAANTGISGFVDPAGRILSKTALFEDAVISGDLPILDDTTFYTRYGDLFAMGCVAVTAVFLLLGRVRRKASPKESETSTLSIGN